MTDPYQRSRHRHHDDVLPASKRRQATVQRDKAGIVAARYSEQMCIRNLPIGEQPLGTYIFAHDEWNVIFQESMLGNLPHSLEQCDRGACSDRCRDRCYVGRYAHEPSFCYWCRRPWPAASSSKPG